MYLLAGHCFLPICLLTEDELLDDTLLLVMYILLILLFFTLPSMTLPILLPCSAAKLLLCCTLKDKRKKGVIWSSGISEHWLWVWSVYGHMEGDGMMEGRNSHGGKQAGFLEAGRAVSCEMLHRKRKRHNLGRFCFLCFVL